MKKREEWKKERDRGKGEMGGKRDRVEKKMEGEEG